MEEKDTKYLRSGQQASAEGTWKLGSITLRVLEGPDRGREATVTGRSLTIGRGPSCDLILTDDGVSRAHASIAHTPLGYAFEDLGSRNGSRVNDVVVQKAILQPGSWIRVADTLIEFCVQMMHLSPSDVEDDQLHGVLGASPAMRSIYGQVLMVAPTEATVVINGETGTGKEMLARAIHQASPRKDGPFVVFDCANVNADLAGTELFGHRKGAFTGANQDHTGAFERAHSGTLLLDEIGELPLDLQARLLGVLQRREVQPLGGNAPKPVDVRVLAATHRDLPGMVEEGRFREDLYFRLMVMAICLPPLRERRDDIPSLARHFLKQLAASVKRTMTFSAPALELLRSHSWRGNVRELQNCVHRAAILTQGNVISPETVAVAVAATAQPRSAPAAARPDPAAGSNRSQEGTKALRSSSKEAEKEAILEALERTGWNKAKAARELDISLATLKRRVREFNLVSPKGGPES